MYYKVIKYVCPNTKCMCVNVCLFFFFLVAEHKSNFLNVLALARTNMHHSRGKGCSLV